MAKGSLAPTTRVPWGLCPSSSWLPNPWFTPGIRSEFLIPVLFWVQLRGPALGS